MDKLKFDIPAAQHTIIGMLHDDAWCMHAPGQGYQITIMVDDKPGRPIVAHYRYEFRDGVSHETTGHIANSCARQLKRGTMVQIKGSHLIPGRWRGRDVLTLARLDSLDWPNKGACAATRELDLEGAAA